MAAIRRHACSRASTRGAADVGWRLKPRLAGAHAPQSLPSEAGSVIGAVPGNAALPRNDPSSRRRVYPAQVRASWPQAREAGCPLGDSAASPPLAHKPMLSDKHIAPSRSPRYNRRQQTNPRVCTPVPATGLLRVRGAFCALTSETDRRGYHRTYCGRWRKPFPWR